MQQSVRRYVTVVCIGALVLGAALFIVAPEYEAEMVRAVMFMAAVGLLAEWMIYTLPHGAVGSIGFIPFLATACLAPSWLTTAGVGVAILISQSVNRVAGLKIVFNVAEHVLTVSAAIIVYRLAGGVSFLEFANEPLLTVVHRSAAPVGLMILTFFLVNSVTVSGVIARSQSLKTWDVWRRNCLSLAVYDIISSPIVLLLAWVFVQWGIVGAALLALPLLGVRQLYKTNLQLQQVNQDLLELMVKAIEARDPYTSGHSRRVSQYSVIIARALSLAPAQIDRVRTAALLHDVGKIHEVFAPILQKPDRLTAAEWAIMKTHPVKSAELVSTATHLQYLVPAVRHHHENWDGSGYPDGLAGEAIPLESRIIMFADTVDAMTTERPYRDALGEADVRAELARCRGTQFDPDVCDTLLQSSAFSLLFPPEKREQKAAAVVVKRRSGESAILRAVVGR